MKETQITTQAFIIVVSPYLPMGPGHGHFLHVWTNLPYTGRQNRPSPQKKFYEDTYFFYFKKLYCI